MIRRTLSASGLDISIDSTVVRAKTPPLISTKTTIRSADWSSASTFMPASPELLSHASLAPTFGSFQPSVPSSSAPSRDQIFDNHNRRLLRLPASLPAPRLGPTTGEIKMTFGWGGRSALRGVVNFKDAF